jgi:hypothetical protein
MDFRHPSRSHQDRTRREDRRSKFYEISDNLSYGNSVTTARIAPGGPHATPHTLFGVHSDLTWYGDASQHAAVVNVDSKILHAQISRNSLLWHGIEAKQGTYNWGVTDDVVNKLIAAGIQPEFTVYGSPSWAKRLTQAS